MQCTVPTSNRCRRSVASSHLQLLVDDGQVMVCLLHVFRHGQDLQVQSYTNLCSTLTAGHLHVLNAPIDLRGVQLALLDRVPAHL